MTARRIPGTDGRLTPQSPPQTPHTAERGRTPPPHRAARAKKAAEPRKSRLDSFTKIAVTVVLLNACAWVWCSYILAYLGRYEIAESLSQTAVTAILGTFISYAVKSAIENINKNGVNLKPTTTTTTMTTAATTTATTTDAVIIGVNADLT